MNTVKKLFVLAFGLLVFTIPVYQVVNAQNFDTLSSERAIVAVGDTGIDPNSEAGLNANGEGTFDPSGENTTDPTGEGVIESPFKANIKNICDLINFFITVITELGAIVAVLFVIWSGFLFIKAQGNESEIKRAKSTFYTTIIGIAILLGASVITQIIFNTVTSIMTVPGGLCQ